MKKKLQQLRDRLTIWAIYRFNIQLPDLLRTPNPRPGRIYYYYGRWFKLVPHSFDTKTFIRRFIDINEVYLLDVPDEHLAMAGRLNDKVRLQNELSSIVCSQCALHKLAIPCKKTHTSFRDDQCVHYKYQLIKGINNEEI